MQTEEYSDGYYQGYQDGWDAALEPAPPSKQEPVATLYISAAAERERIKQENQKCYVFNPDGTYQGSGGGGRPKGDKND